MDEISTTDIQEFALPGSGTIKLSEIKAEFKKGNNLKSYYGVASGIPNSGTIKITDFYGKSSGNVVVDPGGNYYNLSGDYELWADSNAQDTRWINLAKGYGVGDPVALPNTMGFTQRSPDGSYPPPDNQVWGAEIFVEATRIANTLNTYQTLRFSPGSGSVQDFRNGTWSDYNYPDMTERNQDGSVKPDAKTKIFNVTRCVNPDPAFTAIIKNTLISNGSFSLYFMNPTRTAREILELKIESAKMREGL